MLSNEIRQPSGNLSPTPYTAECGYILTEEGLYHGRCGTMNTDPAHIRARFCTHCQKQLNPLAPPLHPAAEKMPENSRLWGWDFTSWIPEYSWTKFDHIEGSTAKWCLVVAGTDPNDIGTRLWLADGTMRVSPFDPTKEKQDDRQHAQDAADADAAPAPEGVGPGNSKAEQGSSVGVRRDIPQGEPHPGPGIGNRTAAELRELVADQVKQGVVTRPDEPLDLGGADRVDLSRELVKVVDR